MGANKSGGGTPPSDALANTRRIARVVLDTRVPHLDRLLDYLVPERLEVTPGIRVLVPLGRSAKLHAGFVVEVASSSDFPGVLHEVADVVSPVSVLTPELWDLACLVAKRQAGSPADVLRLAIPPRAVRVEKQWLEQPREPFSPPPAPSPSPHYDPSSWGEMVAETQRTSLELPPGILHTSTPHPTTVAADTVARLAVSVLSSGKSVVVAVPDWRERDRVERSVREYANPEHLVVWNSEMTPSEKYRAYLRGLDTSPVIILGQRHAIYSPAHNLGLIIVESDSDESHREQLAPYPQTRDVALLRAQQQGCALVLADLVPGVDQVRLIDMGYLTPVKPITRNRPTVIPTALTERARNEPTPGRIPSLAHRAISEALTAGPVLVQVFRAGFAPGLACETCRVRRSCRHCGGPLRAGEKSRQWSCGWCGGVSAPFPCEECGGPGVRPVGHGVGRTVSDLGKAFPRVPVVRSDGDHPITEVDDKPALVVATRGAEPLAPEGYRAVLLLDGDSMLQRTSLGALEETLRGWESAASLAAEGAPVYVTDVEGPVVNAFAAGAHQDLLRRELAERKGLRLPPAIRIASVSGPRAVVSEVTDKVVGSRQGCDVLGPVSVDSGRVRALIRFPYAQGLDIAQALRAEVIERAIGRRNASDRLRVVVDDLDALDHIASQT